MRKYLFILICIVGLTGIFSITAFATDPFTPPVSEENTAIKDNASEHDPIDVENNVPEHTLFTRVWEYIMTHKSEVLEVLGTTILFILTLFVKIKSDKGTRNINTNLIATRKIVDDTFGGQSAVIDRVNHMIDSSNKLSDSYDALKTTYDKYGQTEDDRNKVNGAILVTNTAILEILTTVYANSKNLPQGVKDIISLKYANCLKSLNDTQGLISIVETVRNNINSLTSNKNSDQSTNKPSEE